MICVKCDGKGSIRIKEGKYSICPKCKGNKEYDWIENVLGVEVIKIEMRKYPLIDVKDYDKERLSVFWNYGM